MLKIIEKFCERSDRATEGEKMWLQNGLSRNFDPGRWPVPKFRPWQVACLPCKKTLVLFTDYLGLNSKRYLLLTIFDWIPKGTCYWLSQIEFQKVSVADLPWETANSPVIYFYNSPASASEASCFRVWNISSEVARSATKAASSGVQGWSTC